MNFFMECTKVEEVVRYINANLECRGSSSGAQFIRFSPEREREAMQDSAGDPGRDVRTMSTASRGEVILRFVSPIHSYANASLEALLRLWPG